MISALLIGLFGSVHCAGMCAPIMLSLTKNAEKHAVSSFVLYHLGRISIYAFIGVFFGLLSASVQFFSFQKYFTILIGFLILTIFAFPNIRSRFEGWYYHSWFYQKVKAQLIPLYASRLRWLAAGVLNGILPCGLVYLAAAGAMLAGNALSGALYMVVFGVGTLPVLIGIGVFRRYLSGLLSKFPNITTTIALISGIILLARGIFAKNPDLNHLVRAQIMNVVSVCGF